MLFTARLQLAGSSWPACGLRVVVTTLLRKCAVAPLESYHAELPDADLRRTTFANDLRICSLETLDVSRPWQVQGVAFGSSTQKNRLSRTAAVPMWLHLMCAALLCLDRCSASLTQRQTSVSSEHICPPNELKGLRQRNFTEYQSLYMHEDLDSLHRNTLQVFTAICID